MFSLKRIANLFHIEFTYHKKLYLYFVILVFSVFILIHIFSRLYWINSLIDVRTPANEIIFFLFASSSYIISIYMMFDHYNAIHDPLRSVLYLSLPVSALERYFFNLVKFLFVFPLFLILCYYSAFNFIVLLDNVFSVENKTDYFSMHLIFKFLKMTYFNYLIAFPIFLLSSLIFKSYPFLKAVLIGVLLFGFLAAFFDFAIFFTDAYIFSELYNFSILHKGYSLFKIVCMLFSSFLYFSLYFVLNNLGCLNSRSNLRILLGLIPFFPCAIFLIIILSFLCMYNLL
ncbi:ABC transporter permease [Candidatus Borreliella tachyglossi]|uniref:ABC transporter permease n=1 Tax=Candidatus Borreliella tachyglossi TaxID=1964448 RepID=UPI0040426A68